MRASAPRAYLDSNVFITAFEQEGAAADHAWWILKAIETGQITGATSELTLAEVLVKPIERRATELASAYTAMLQTGENFRVLPVGRDVLIAAAGIRAEALPVRLPDAIHIASAKAMDCAFFVSGDRRLRVPEGMMRLEINPFTLDDVLKESR